MQAVPDLFSIQAHQQRSHDSQSQPSDVGHQSHGHQCEALVSEKAYHKDGESEEEETEGGEIGASLFAKIVRQPPPWSKAEQGSGQSDGEQYVGQHKEEHEHHHGAAPFAVGRREMIKRGVLLFEIGTGDGHHFGQVTQDVQIVVTTIEENVLLKAAIARHGIGVERFYFRFDSQIIDAVTF